jgi:hypothetical protein
METNLIVTRKNDFNVDLVYSLEGNFDRSINDAYFKAFPHLKEIRTVTELAKQRLGIDKELIFENDNIVYVDEKKRRVDYGDILLEEYSNFETKKVGWLGRDKYTDYIAYAVMPSHKVYFLPFLLLQKTWVENWAEWLLRFGRKLAINNGYTTSNIPIPVKVLMDSLREAMLLQR